MAHAGVTQGASAYKVIHFSIRARLYKGLRTGAMQLGPLADDERLKMILPQACGYCGGTSHLAADHVIARSRGGPDVGDNLIWSCRSCNSRKGTKDLLAWYASRGEFPPLLLLRRYLKLAIGLAADHRLLEDPIDGMLNLPVDVVSAPQTYPLPPTLRLWVVPLPA